MHKRRASILLVEDRQEDQIVIQRAFEDGRIGCDLSIANHGQQALQMLLKEPPYEDAMPCLPDLIMMDINMPVMNGKDALREIRNGDRIKHIPVIMLTTSNRDKDVMESYQLGVNAYLSKPVEHEAFLRVIRQIQIFWLELVTLPTRED